jgi:urease alpha subunit
MEYNQEKRVEAASDVYGLTKLDIKLNDALPNLDIDPETYTVTADGEVLTRQPQHQQYHYLVIFSHFKRPLLSNSSRSRYSKF